MHSPQKLRLLIVEDDVLDFRRLREALRERGPDRYFVRHAASLDQAATTLAEESFDVILLDVSLPDGSGVEQIATLQDAAPGALILSLGSGMDEEAGLRAIGNGAQDYLDKESLSDTRLTQAIEFAVARRDFQPNGDAEAALLRCMDDQSAELAIVVDAAGHVAHGHDNLRRTLGHQPADLHFKTWINLLHPGDQERARETWSQVLAEPGGEGEVVARLPRPQGQWRAHRLRLTNRLDAPAIEGVVITGPDVEGEAGLQHIVERWSDLARLLLDADDIESAVIAGLAQIGAVLGVDHIRVVEYVAGDEPGQLSAQPRYAWRRQAGEPGDMRPDTLRTIGDIEVLLQLRDAARREAADGMVRITPRRSFKEPRHALEPLALLPITARGRIWGAVAIAVPAAMPEWRPEQRIALRAMLDMLGAAVMREAPRNAPAPGASHLGPILDTIASGVLLFGHDGELLHANPAVSAITGMTPELFLNAQLELMAGSGVHSFDQTFQHPGGKLVHARVEVSALRDEQGTYAGGVIAIQDTSSIRRAAQLMHGNEVRLRAIVATAIEAILTLDADGNIESLNPSAERMFGISVDDAIGERMSSLIPEPPAGEHLQYLHELLDAAPEHADGLARELYALRRDGAVFPIEMSLQHYEQRNQPKYIASIRDVSERRAAEERVAAQLRQLQALHRVDRTLTGTRDQQVILDVVADQIVMIPDVDIALIRVFQRANRRLTLEAERGLPTRAIAEPSAALGQGLAGLVAVERASAKLRQRADMLIREGDAEAFANQPLVDGLAIPLIANTQLKGTLEVYSFAPGGVSDETAAFVGRLAAQAALAVDETELFAALTRSKQHLESAYEAALEGWSRALEMRGVDTHGHSRRVAELAVKLGEAVGLEADELTALRRGALLHDIGKIGLPDAVLHKPGSLDEADWALIRDVPHHAIKLLNGIPFLRTAAEVPYFHHEKWDGMGYPHGLVGEAIPLAARIFAVVDVWDTMISDRPYRRALTREQAIEQIAAQSGASFDPSVVKEFLSIVGRLPGEESAGEDVRVAESPALVAEAAGRDGKVPPDAPAGMTRE